MIKRAEREGRRRKEKEGSDKLRRKFLVKVKSSEEVTDDGFGSREREREKDWAK